MNKSQIVEQLQLHEIFANVSKKQTQEFVEDFFTMIEDQIVEGNAVTIPGFGKFEGYTRTNGVKTPKFRPYKAFKEKVA